MTKKYKRMFYLLLPSLLYFFVNTKYSNWTNKLAFTKSLWNKPTLKCKAGYTRSIGLSVFPWLSELLKLWTVYWWTVNPKSCGWWILEYFEIVSLQASVSGWSILNEWNIDCLYTWLSTISALSAVKLWKQSLNGSWGRKQLCCNNLQLSALEASDGNNDTRVLTCVCRIVCTLLKHRHFHV